MRSWNANVGRFAERLGSRSATVRSVIDLTVNEWAPEAPPPTIFLGYLGRQIAEDLNRTLPAYDAAMFEEIELAMGSDDDEFGTAVATGLVEALVNRTLENGNWDEVRDLLVTKTLFHADAWRNF